MSTLTPFVALTLASLALPATHAPSEPIHGEVAPCEAGRSGTQLRFVRPTRTALAITGAETHDLVLRSLSTQFGDKDPVAQPTALRLRTRLDSALADEVDPLGHLRRRYLDLAGAIQIMDPASVDEAAGTWNGTEFALTSPLSGTGVAFVAADGQPDGFGRHFDQGKLREPLLPNLAAPFDWGRLLPPTGADGAPVSLELGDTWQLDPADIEALVTPGGFLAWRPGEEGADPQVLRAFQSGVGGNVKLAFDGKVEGTAQARLATVGVDDEDGRYAEFSVTFDIAMAAARDQLVEQRRLETEGELDVEMLGGDLAIGFVGEATVRWSRDLQRPLRALVASRESVTMSVRVLPEEGEVVTQTMTMVGSLASNLKFKDVPLRPSRRAAVDQR